MVPATVPRNCLYLWQKYLSKLYHPFDKLNGFLSFVLIFTNCIRTGG